MKEVFFTDKTSLKIFDFITCVKNSSTAYVEKENFQSLKWKFFSCEIFDKIQLVPFLLLINSEIEK